MVAACTEGEVPSVSVDKDDIANHEKLPFRRMKTVTAKPPAAVISTRIVKQHNIFKSAEVPFREIKLTVSTEPPVILKVTPPPALADEKSSGKLYFNPGTRMTKYFTSKSRKS